MTPYFRNHKRTAGAAERQRFSKLNLEIVLLKRINASRLRIRNLKLVPLLEFPAFEAMRDPEALFAAFILSCA
jgi:hypothetical protein